jgi:hypothetical protein
MRVSFRSALMYGVPLTLLLSALNVNTQAALQAVNRISVPTILAGREDSGAVWYAQLEILNRTDQDVPVGIMAYNNNGETAFLDPHSLATDPLTVPADGKLLRFIRADSEPLEQGWIEIEHTVGPDGATLIQASATLIRVEGQDVTNTVIPGSQVIGQVRTIALANYFGPLLGAASEIFQMTAYALVNPLLEASTVTVELHQWDGDSEVRTKSFELPPKGRRALFLHEIFTDPDLLAVPGAIVDTFTLLPPSVRKTGLLVISGAGAESSGVGAGTLEVDFRTGRLSPRDVRPAVLE